MPTLVALVVLSLVAAALLALWTMAKAALANERQRSAQLGQSLAAADADRDAQRDRATQSEVRAASLGSSLAETQKAVQERQSALDAALSRLDASRQTASGLQGELAKVEALAAERQAQFQKFQAKLDEHLAALTRKLYDEHGPKMLDEGRQQLEQALAPFKEKLAEFQNRVNEVHAGDLRDRASLETTLRKELEGVLKAQSQLSGDAQRLTLALTGDSRAQGDWGELTLQRLLEESGLRQNIDYKLQLVVVDEGEEESKRWRPDVVVYLPESRVIVIDAKCSITAHAKAMGVDADARPALMADHLKSVKSHVAMLASREYPKVAAEYLGKGTPDFTLLFLPTEASWAAAMEQEPGLWLWAYSKKIVIVTPQTLLVTLRIVETQWRLDRQNKNTEQIVREAGLLVKRLADSMDDFEKADRAMDGALATFRAAKSRLSGGPGSVARKAQLMIELGVKASANVKETLDKADDGDDEPEQSPDPA